jgi:hypothetical protein
MGLSGVKDASTLTVLSHTDASITPRRNQIITSLFFFFFVHPLLTTTTA